MAFPFKRIARAIFWVATVLAAAYLIFMLTARFLLHELPFMGETFTSEKWAEAGNCQGLTDYHCEMKNSECPRGPMVRSLLRDHLKTGTSREVVTGLLGPALRSEKDAAGCMDWSIGMCSGFGWDYDSLFVCFDAADHLVEAGHVQH